MDQAVLEPLPSGCHGLVQQSDLAHIWIQARLPVHSWLPIVLLLCREKSFCKFFRKVFRSFCEVFQRFRKFFEVFRKLFEAFGSIRTHCDAFGCIWKQLEAFGRFRKFLRFFGFLSRFSTFPDVIFTKDFFHGRIYNHAAADRFVVVFDLFRRRFRSFRPCFRSFRHHF